MFSFDLLKLGDKENESISYDIIINRDFFKCDLITKVKEVISDAENLDILHEEKNEDQEVIQTMMTLIKSKKIKM